MSPGRDTVVAVVVYYSGLARARRCLDSLEAQDHPNLHVILVDHSREGEGELVVSGRKRMRLVRPPANAGFAAGVRAALARDPSPTVLLLNPDAQADPTWARRMESALAENPRHGMAAVRVLSGRNPSRLDSAGLGISPGGTSILRGHGARSNISRSHLDTVPLVGPSGAAAAYRRAALDAVGGFSSAYFLYYEDMEAAWRMRLGGWSCAWVNEPLVTHDHVSGAGREKYYHLHRSRRLFLLRNRPERWRGSSRLARTWEDFASRLSLAVREGWEATRRARRDAEQAHADAPNTTISPLSLPDPSWLASRPGRLHWLTRWRL